MAVRQQTRNDTRMRFIPTEIISENRLSLETIVSGYSRSSTTHVGIMELWWSHSIKMVSRMQCSLFPDHFSFVQYIIIVLRNSIVIGN